MTHRTLESSTCSFCPHSFGITDVTGDSFKLGEAGGGMDVYLWFAKGMKGAKKRELMLRPGGGRTSQCLHAPGHSSEEHWHTEHCG